MNLEKFGYTDKIKKLNNENNQQEFELGRVIAEHKERYVVVTNNGEIEAEITGNLRFKAQGREDFPAVGDWVTLQAYDADFAIIHNVLPRLSMISRQAVGQSGSLQIIATNVDYAFLIQAVDRDFNVNRLQRYLTICYSSKVEPIIVLTKTDLIDRENLDEIRDKIKDRIKDVIVLAISNETEDGYEKLNSILQQGKTYCMLGSSGVGKSTLTNNLSGRTRMKTDVISQSTNKGRHVTTHREMVLIDNGAILIDNPGMREVGITDTSGGLEATFDLITEYSQSCKFTDCTHTSEIGCAVLKAIETGEIDERSYTNYLKLEKEKAHFESTALEKRKKDKDFGKLVKGYQKLKKKKKF